MTADDLLAVAGRTLNPLYAAFCMERDIPISYGVMTPDGGVTRARRNADFMAWTAERWRETWTRLGIQHHSPLTDETLRAMLETVAARIPDGAELKLT